MDKLHFLTCQPSDLYFVWQLQIQLTNFRKYGLSDCCSVLVWRKFDNPVTRRDFQKEWKSLESKFPEVKFYYQDNDGQLSTMIQSVGYIPLLRPWLLAKHFIVHPELKNDNIFYLDSDVVFTREPKFDNLLENNICQLSNTKSYIAASYFDSKEKDVLPHKLEEYKKIDVLDGIMKLFGLSRHDAVTNEEGSGGAQYILKNIDHFFWQDVFKGCILIRNYLTNINRNYFENEDKGFQVWCADMWSILYNLWKRGIKTDCPKEMDFCWATDARSRWDEVQIYHDAGASTRPIREGHKLFHKREAKYINNTGTPFEDDLSFVSSEYCSKNYVACIEEAK